MTYSFPLDNLVFDMGWHTYDAKIGTGHAGSRICGACIPEVRAPFFFVIT